MTLQKSVIMTGDSLNMALLLTI